METVDHSAIDLLLTVCNVVELANLRNRISQPKAYDEPYIIEPIAGALVVVRIDEEFVRRGLKPHIRKILK